MSMKKEKRNPWIRPKTVAQICEFAMDGENWGMNVRDWQHVIRNFHSRSEFEGSIQDPPAIMRDVLKDEGQCDGYLAAYVEWLCDRAGVEPPEWVFDPRRVATKSWYDFPRLWAQSFVEAPGAFRRRGIFTLPDNVLNLRPGRPRKSDAEKRATNAARQKRYRQRVKEKLEKLRELEKAST